MFVLDYISAFFLAVAFTIAFTNAMGERSYGAWRDMPAKVWFVAAASWLLGTIVVAVGAIMAHWLTLVVGAGALALIAFSMMQRALAKTVLPAVRPGPGDDARPAIALFFCITLLLFFCAISVRFYVVNLG